MGENGTRLQAVVFVFLMVSSVVFAPIAHALPTNGGQVHVGNVAIDDTLSPHEQKQQALDEALMLDPQRPQQHVGAERAAEKLRATTGDIYLDDTRVDDQHVFIDDSQTVRALASFSQADDPTRALRITNRIATADNESAWRSITDAKSALERYRGDLTHGQIAGAEAHIASAERAFDRAQDRLVQAENSGTERHNQLRQRINQRASAVTQMRTAWHQAQLALERIDAGVEPEIELGTTVDPVWEDGQPDVYYVTGEVSDLVRVDESATVTVSIGDRTHNVSTDAASHSPIATRTFAVQVNRTQRVSEIEIASVPDAETATLALDGDGLPASFEQQIGSDPLDPDSDIEALGGNQAGDGVHDGAHVAQSDALVDTLANASVLRPTPAFVGNDTDGDGIPDVRELQLGLNATNNDTDGDGVGDRYETIGGAAIDWDGDGTLDALDRDSDGDGVYDRREGRSDVDDDLRPGYHDLDDDGDGIPSWIEVENGTTYAHDVDFDDIVNWRDPDADDDGLPDGEEGLIDHDGEGMPAYLDNDRDNDGLPGWYERNVTGTDPANNDSDAPTTGVSEAGNGVIDGAEDFDGDGLATFTEYQIGTDPFGADTDGDDLDDGFENSQPGLDPTLTDSDDDGVQDGEADPDGDGLTNIEEAGHGTIISIADTDGDGLFDAGEIANGTDPLSADTDEDGLDDREERSLPTDPLNPDTDGDGVLDGDETFRTVALNESEGVTVEFTGRGDVASTFILHNETNSRLTNGVGDALVSRPLRFETDRPFTQANVTIEYDERDVDVQNATIALARFNETSQTLDLLNSTIDTANNTVTGQTDRFSWIMTVDVRKYVTNFESNPSDWTGSGDIVLFDDFEDGEIGPWTCHSEPRSSGYDNTPTLGHCLEEDGNVTVLEHTNRMRTLNRTVQLPENISNLTLRAKVDAVVQSRWSRGEARLVIADSSATETVYKLHNRGSGAYRSDSAEIGVDISHLSGESVTIEFRADGRHTYRYSNTASSISVDYIAITADGQGLPDTPADSDGDGLPDEMEYAFSIGTGETLHTYPNDPDTDGDGLSDGTEVDALVEGRTQQIWVDGAPISVDYSYWRLNSNPTEVDSDGDGLDDATETDGWQINVSHDRNVSQNYMDAWLESQRNDEPAPDEKTYLQQALVTSDPLAVHSDDDGINDSEEEAIGTDPSAEDTDGDTADDDYELEQGADPTLFDHRAPDIIVYDVEANAVTRTHYTVRYRVWDVSGVSKIHFIKRDEIQETVEFDGRRVPGYRTVEFDFDRGAIDQIVVGVGSPFTHSRVNVTTVDIHGNDREGEHLGVSLLPKIADWIADQPWIRTVDIPAPSGQGDADALKAYIVTRIAYYDGAIWGVKGSVTGLIDLVTNPEMLREVPDAAGQIPDLLSELPQVVVDFQDAHNPYDRDSPYYGFFGGSWLTGYTLGMIGGEAALGKGIGTGARVARTTRIANLLRGARITSQGALVRGSSVLAARVVDDVPVGADTLGAAFGRTAVVKQVPLADNLRHVGQGLDEIGSVAANGHARAVALVRHTGRPGAALLRAGHGARTFPMRTVLSIEDRVAMWRTLSRVYARNPDVGVEEIGVAMHRYGSLQTRAQRQAFRGWWLAAGDDGIEATARLSDDSVSTLADDAVTAADGGRTLDTRFRSAIARAADSDAIDDYGQLDDFVRSVDGLSDAQQVTAKTLIVQTGDDGLQVWQHVDDASFGELLTVSSTDDLVSATRKFSRLRADDQARFARIIEDPEVRESWVGAVSAEGIGSSEISYALNRVDEIEEFGQVERFAVGRVVQRQEYPPGYDTVYPEQSIVSEYALTENTRFFRLYTEGQNAMASRFLLRNQEDIVNLSPEELQGKYAIPNDPPDTVAVADIPAGTTMRTGRVARNSFGSGGRTQYTIPKSRVPDSEFNKNWFTRSDELTKELNN